MFCTACAAFNPASVQRCLSCGAGLGGARRTGAKRRLVSRARRSIGWTLTVWPVLLLLIAGVAVGGRFRADQAGLAAAYARGELALASGDYDGAIVAFAEAGSYRDATTRRSATIDALAPYRAAYLDGVAAVESQRYEAAIAALLPVARALPTYQDTLPLLEAARAGREGELERIAEVAISRHDWLSADRALAELLGHDPGNAELEHRLATLRQNHAPILFTRDSALYMVGPDLADERLITDDVPVAIPVWSPDRARIAFVSPDDEALQMMGTLYVVDADGGNLRSVSERVVMDWWPAWSPDGTRIAYTSGERFEANGEPGRFSIRIADLVAGTTRDLTAERLPNAGIASWAPDGRRLAFVGYRVFIDYGLGNASQRDGDLYIADLETGELTNLTEQRLLGVTMGSWSPVGDRILIYTVDPGPAWVERNATRIHLLDLATNTIEALTGPTQAVGRPYWSPDGTRFAFVEGSEADGRGAVIHVRWFPGRREAGIGITRAMTHMITWAPDGKALIAMAADPSQGSILVPLPDGPGSQTDLPLEFDLDWPNAGPLQWGPAIVAPLPSPESVWGTALDPIGPPTGPNLPPAAARTLGGW